MKGLLIKDFKLMKSQKQFFMILAVIGIVFVIFYENPSFGVSYITIMFSLFTISTISYDEYENGASYLFTLPISRKSYVKEKYVYGLLTMFVGLIVMSVVTLGVAAVRHIEYEKGEWFVCVLVSMAVIVWMYAVTIPIQLKVGPEKTRMAMMAVIIVGILIVYGALKIGETLGVDVKELFDWIFEVKMGAIVIAAIVAVCAGILFISYCISVKFMEMREF